jgi:hypothetical protein
MEMLRAEVSAKLEKLERLQHRAQLCRDLAETALTVAARDILFDMALEFDGHASALQNNGDIAH